MLDNDIAAGVDERGKLGLGHRHRRRIRQSHINSMQIPVSVVQTGSQAFSYTASRLATVGRDIGNQRVGVLRHVADVWGGRPTDYFYVGDVHVAINRNWFDQWYDVAPFGAGRARSVEQAPIDAGSVRSRRAMMAMGANLWLL